MACSISSTDQDTTTDSGNQVDLCLLVSRGDHIAVEACLQETPALIHRVRWSGVGPLHRAVANGDLRMATLLLRHGADANARASWGWYTPLHLACKQGDEKLITLLLSHGGKWQMGDKRKKTPLQWAVHAGKASIAYRIDQQLHREATAIKHKQRQQQEDMDMATEFSSTGLFIT